MSVALRSWQQLGSKQYDFYFSVQRASGDLWSGRVDDAVLGLKKAIGAMPASTYDKASSPPRQRSRSSNTKHNSGRKKGKDKKSKRDKSDSDASSDSESSVSSASSSSRSSSSNSSNNSQKDEGGETDNAAGLSVRIAVLQCGLDVSTATCLAAHHNLAVALIALRRYKEALPWVTKSLDIATAHAEELTHNPSLVDQCSVQTVLRYHDLRETQGAECDEL